MVYKPKLLIFLLLTIFCSKLISQDLNDVYIFGYVTDSTSDRRVQNVLIEAINESDSTQKCSTYSDYRGGYKLHFITSLVRDGQYQKIPANFRLWQNYPNPFNPITRINYQIPYSCDLHLAIYDILGQKVKTLINQHVRSGSYSVTWDATNDLGLGVSAGIYFYQLRAGDFIETKKMILLDGTYKEPLTLSLKISQDRAESCRLAKALNLSVTIKASGSWIKPYEMKNVVISSQNFRHDIEVAVLKWSFLNIDSLLVSEPSADGSVYISGLPNTLMDQIKGTEKILAVNQRSQEEVSMRFKYHGGFPLMRMSLMLGIS